ncbi:MAG: helix-turn-helix transcriptional regulator [Symploca sp. SIO2E9]|nr:helix-turn-helix transcriptional regulator [Symploca sp. SIO2E9]
MSVTGKTASQLHEEWRKNPEYLREYEALEEEFSLAGALIEARSRAGLSQEELAKRMCTSQSAIARLEGGKQNVSLKLLRRYAQATKSRLKISLEPISTSTGGQG